VSEDEAARFDRVAAHYGIPVAAMLRMLVKERDEALSPKPLHLNFTISETKPGHVVVEPADAPTLEASAAHKAAIDRLLEQHASGMSQGGRLPRADDVASRALFAVNQALMLGGVVRSREDICCLGWRADAPPFSNKVKTIVFSPTVRK